MSMSYDDWMCGNGINGDEEIQMAEGSFIWNSAIKHNKTNPKLPTLKEIQREVLVNPPVYEIPQNPLDICEAVYNYIKQYLEQK